MRLELYIAMMGIPLRCFGFSKNAAHPISQVDDPHYNCASIDGSAPSCRRKKRWLENRLIPR